MYPRRGAFLGLLLLCFVGISRNGEAEELRKTTVAYRLVAGHSILADVYRPSDATVSPVIVYIHGGALIMGNRQLEWAGRNDYRSKHPEEFDVLEFAQKHAYALVSIDYRLAPETKLPAIIGDVEAAFRWIGGEGVREFHLDTNHLVVIGGSAGGYLTLLTGFRVTPKPKALISLYGYGQLNADWYTKPNPYPGYNQKPVSREEAMQQTSGEVVSDSEKRKGDSGAIYMYYRQTGLWPQEVSGFDAQSLAEQIAQYEPARHVTHDYPPTLMIHGTQDTDVPFEESANMALQFKKHGVPYILLPINKGEHGFVGGDPVQIKEASQTIEDFMTRYLDAK